MSYLELAKEVAEGNIRPSPIDESLRDRAMRVVEEVITWASIYPNKWESVISALKRGWDPSQGIDSPRDVAIHWARAYQRLTEARRALLRLTEKGWRLNKKEVVAKASREATVSFSERLTWSLHRRAISAFSEDPKAIELMSKLLHRVQK